MAVNMHTARPAFLFAPRLTHERVDRLTPAQQAEALHEYVELYGSLKRHVFNPDKNPHTRVLAMAVLIDQAEKASAKRKDLGEPLPFWAGDKNEPGQENSFSARTGFSKNFVSSELQALERAQLVARSKRRTDNGNDHTDLAVLPALLSSPELLPNKGERPRKPPVLCRECGSDVLVKEQQTRVTCACCGAVHSEHKSETMVNEEEEDSPIITREVTIGGEDIITREVTIANSTPLLLSLSETFDKAAALLVEIAGDEPKHGEMAMWDKEGNYCKYGYRFYQFALRDARAHLEGKKTKAARLLRQDGKTRALCFDADTHEDWQSLQDAAHLLRAAGYVVLMEDSPIGRGGHLWIIYTDLVDARAAHRHVCELAPMLAGIEEYWPHHKQNVRLPGGKYIVLEHEEKQEDETVKLIPAFSAQCKLYDAIGAQIAETRAEAAAALLTHQTPAAIVPTYPPDPAPEPAKLSLRKDKSIVPAQRQLSDSPTVAQLVARFNETHRLEDIHPLETATHARATWRNEKGRPSVSYLQDNRWYDHGHTDQKTGDAFDLACLVEGKSKSEKRRELLAQAPYTRRTSTVQEEKSVTMTDLPETACRASESNERLGNFPVRQERDEAPGGGLSAHFCADCSWAMATVEITSASTGETVYLCAACDKKRGQSHAA